jgi:membrane protease YdiL (CAAX protease family)
VELVVAYALILLVIWSPRPLQRWFYWAAIVWILLAVPGSFREWKTMGFRTAGFWRSFWILCAALLAAGIAVAFASRLGTLHLPSTLTGFLLGFAGYGIGAFVQQFLLQDFFLLRLLRLVHRKAAAVALAVGMFALAHLPNPILTPAALLWGLISCLVFLRYRNLFTLGIAHAVLGIALAVSVPGQLDHNMRVGLGYLTFRPHHHHRNQKDHIVSTDAWVRAEAPTRRSRRTRRWLTSATDSRSEERASNPQSSHPPCIENHPLVICDLRNPRQST